MPGGDTLEQLFEHARRERSPARRRELAARLGRLAVDAVATRQHRRAWRVFELLEELADTDDEADPFQLARFEALRTARFSPEAADGDELEALVDLLQFATGDIYELDPERAGPSALGVLRTVARARCSDVAVQDALAYALYGCVFSVALHDGPWPERERLLAELEGIGSRPGASSEQRVALIDALAYEVSRAADARDAIRGRSLLSRLATVASGPAPLDDALGAAVDWLSSALFGRASEVFAELESPILAQLRALAGRAEATTHERDTYAENLERCLLRAEELGDAPRISRLLDGLRRIGHRSDATALERLSLARALYNRQLAREEADDERGAALLDELDALARRDGYRGPINDELVTAIGNAHVHASERNDAERERSYRAKIIEHATRDDATEAAQRQLVMMISRDAERAERLDELRSLVERLAALTANARSSTQQLELYAAALRRLYELAIADASLAHARAARSRLRALANRDDATARQVELFAELDGER